MSEQARERHGIAYRPKTVQGFGVRLPGGADQTDISLKNQYI